MHDSYCAQYLIAVPNGARLNLHLLTMCLNFGCSDDIFIFLALKQKQFEWEKRPSHFFRTFLIYRIPKQS